MESAISAFQMVGSELDHVAGHFVWPDAATLQFNPDLPLAASETYAIAIAAGAGDKYGKTVGNGYSFWFKTQP